MTSTVANAALPAEKIKQPEPWRGWEWLVLALGCALTCVLACNGWRARHLWEAIDQGIHFQQADLLLHSGRLPDHGVVSSLRSFIPPGTAWLMVPGMLTGNMLLFELVGAIMTALAAGVGVYLLTRRGFGRTAALLALTLYVLSPISAQFAYTLWPRGRPEFWVWITLFTALWVEKRQAWYLAAALVTFGVGAYVFMEVLPAFVIILAALWIYRPPLRAVPLGVAVIAVIAIWAPYLHFETQRGFADLRSQLLVKPLPVDEVPVVPIQDVRANDLLNTTVYPVTMMGGVDDLAVQPAPLPSDSWLHSFKVRARYKLALACRAIVSNFLPSGVWGYFGLVLFFALLVFNWPMLPRALRALAEYRGVQRGAVGALMVAAVAAGGLAGYRWLHHQTALQDSLRMAAAACAAAAVFIAGARPLANFLDPRTARVSAYFRAMPAATVTAIGVALAWLLMMALSANPSRIWGMWSLHVVLLAGAAVMLPRLLRWRRAARMLVIGLVLFCISGQFVMAASKALLTEPFAGREAEDVHAARRLAAYIRAAKLESPRVGYHIGVMFFEIGYHVVDPAYKAGCQFDMFLGYAFGIHNANQTVVGFSDEDDFRLVQYRLLDENDGAHLTGVPFKDAARYRLIETTPVYQIWARPELAEKIRGTE